MIDIQVVSTVSNSISSAPSVLLAAIAARCKRFMQTGMLCNTTNYSDLWGYCQVGLD